MCKICEPVQRNKKMQVNKCKMCARVVTKKNQSIGIDTLYRDGAGQIPCNPHTMFPVRRPPLLLPAASLQLFSQVRHYAHAQVYVTHISPSSTSLDQVFPLSCHGLKFGTWPLTMEQEGPRLLYLSSVPPPVQFLGTDSVHTVHNQ